MFAVSEYASDDYSDQQLEELLRAHTRFARSFDLVSDAALEVAVVELAKPAVQDVNTALRAYTAYVGYGNISWPSKFRSIIMARNENVSARETALGPFVRRLANS
jgi:hypothetical protein